MPLNKEGWLLLTIVAEIPVLSPYLGAEAAVALQRSPKPMWQEVGI